MMWNSTGRNDRLTTPPASNNIATDHFNNNPYSRNNPVNQPPLAKVQQDPWNWNWGWDEDSSGGQQGGGTGHEENDSWGAQPQSTLHHHHSHQQQLHHQPPQQPYNHSMLSTNNSSEFFENIDLSGSTTANNKLFNQPPPPTHQQQPQHYLNQHPQPPPPQQFFQPQKQPQVSTNSSYSYFQFAEPSQPQSLNSSLVNQFPSATALVSQSQPTSLPYNTNNTHTAPQYSQQSHLSQPQFTSQTPPNYNQFSSSAPFSQHQPLMGYNTGSPSNIINNNNNNNNNNNIPTSSEVENREIAPPEKTGDKGLNIIQPPPPLSTSLSTAPALSSPSVVNSKSSNSVPDNQETVPENEERPPDPDTITSSMSNLRLNNSSSTNTAPVMETTPVPAASHDQQLQQQWNSHSGWENQEVAPRFTVDRDQYLETGHLHPPPSQLHPQQSAGILDNDVDADTNDEGEAAPPPGLHRLVTGQGQTVGQERLVVGSLPPPPPSSSAGPPSLSQRPHVPGHSMHQLPDLSSHPSPPPLGQRMIPGQLRDDDMERMVLGSSGNSGNDNNISGSAQQQRDQLQNNPVSQRTVPGGRSNDMQQTSSRDRDQQQNDHVSQRTVPGGSSSSSGSASSYTQIQDLQSDERLVLGRTTVDEGDDRLQQTQNTNAAVHNAAAATTIWTSSNTSHQDSVITTHTPSTYQGDADGASQQPPRPPSNTNSIVGADQSRSNSVVSDPPPGLHRMVLGHPDNSSRGGSASGDETSQSGVPPPGLHRMVLGEQQQEQKQPDQQPQQPTLVSQVQSQSQGSNADNEDCDKDRELDSDNEFRIRRKQHHRRDSEEDRDYPSDRERERDRRNPDYWERRYDERSRRHYKDRSHHTSYDHSPEYRSEEELDRDRNDYRDHREHRGSGRSRDTRERDRERERDRRRQSPDYYYREEEYRDDQRRPGRDRRYYETHHYRDRNMYEEDYYYRENRSSRPSSRSGMEYPRRPGVTSGPRDYLQSRNVHPYYPDQGKRIPTHLHKSRSFCAPTAIRSSPILHPELNVNESFPALPGAYQMHYYQLQQQYYEMRRNDPQAYAAWYEQYMASKYGQQAHHPDDSRTSVHSGRSSANHHRSSNEKVLLDESGISVASSKINTTGVPGAIDHLGQQIGAKNDTTDLGGVDSASRYTPQLYPRGAHIKGKWSKQGQLVLVSPNYPNEGQPPIVEVLQLSFTSLQNETDVLEFLETPGPFIVGVTHKNSVLQYLKRRADQASHNAEKLLYELMQLVIRLNGVVDMTDVADLLMANYNEDPGAEHDVQHQAQQLAAQMGDSVGQQDINNSNSSSGASDAQQVTDRFRDLLLQGNKLDALEWAMQNKNWGHAFFLASKMDARSYNNVMLRFANGLPANDPLQTLYQMMSGREPQAATCCADKKWGDWRPHLAMMLSNPSGNPDLDRKSIISLGDSLGQQLKGWFEPLEVLLCRKRGVMWFTVYCLPHCVERVSLSACQALRKASTFHPANDTFTSFTAGSGCIVKFITLRTDNSSRGRLFASHFCYVTAQVEFSAFTDRSAKLVLLGTSHHQPFAQFATCRSIMLTLCYEYAKRLNKKDLTIPALQVYKYLLATRLIENGKLAVASQYLEALALDMVHRPSRQNRPLALLVAELADQIKMADPALAMISDPNDDPDWLNTLKQILDDTNDTNLQTSSMSHGISTSTVSTSAADPAPSVNQVVGGYGQEQMMYYDPNLNTWNQSEPQQLDSMQYNTGYSAGPNNEIADDPYLQQQQQLQQQQVPLQNTGNGQLINADYNSMQTLQNQQQNSGPVSWDPVNNMYNTNSWQDQTQHPQVQTSLPPISTSAMSSSAVTQPVTTKPETTPSEQQKLSPEKKPNKDENSNRRSTKKNKEQASSGWFGGIWDKFALRPKNQMKLPDDKNPSIVWDEKKGRWVNKDGDEEDESLGVRPPPKASELPGFGNSAPPPPVPHPAPVTPSTNENIIPVPVPTATSTPSSAPSGLPPPSSNSINKFKMQRGRGMKANYIDVMNPNSTKKLGGPAPGAPLPMMDTMPNVTAPVNNFFIPAPVEGNENAPIDFVSSSGPVSFEASHKPLDQTTELSRSSSASSLSREVSNIMSRTRRQLAQQKSFNNVNRQQHSHLHTSAKYSTPDVPTFYNPNSFTVT